MTERILLGYGGFSNAPPCPYCGDSHYAIVDDGNPTSVRVDCWCGAHARCQRDDPDLIAAMEVS